MRGGWLRSVTSYLTGYVDDTDLCFLGGFPGPLRECLGIWAEELDALYDGDANAVVADPGSSLGLGGRFAVKEYCEVIHAETAEVLATYGADFYAGRPPSPATASGRGDALHIAAPHRRGLPLRVLRQAASPRSGSRPASRPSRRRASPSTAAGTGRTTSSS